MQISYAHQALPDQSSYLMTSQSFYLVKYFSQPKDFVISLRISLRSQPAAVHKVREARSSRAAVHYVRER